MLGRYTPRAFVYIATDPGFLTLDRKIRHNFFLQLQCCTNLCKTVLKAIPPTGLTPFPTDFQQGITHSLLHFFVSFVSIVPTNKNSLCFHFSSPLSPSRSTFPPTSTLGRCQTYYSITVL